MTPIFAMLARSASVWSIGKLPGSKLWYDAAHATLNGGNYQTLTELSGSGAGDAEQLTPSAQPARVADFDGLGHPAIQGASGDFVEEILQDVTQPFTAIIAGSWHSATGVNASWFDGGGAAGKRVALRQNTSNQPALFAGSGIIGTTAPAVAGEACFAIVDVDGDSSRIYIEFADGTVIDEGVVGAGTDDLRGVTIGNDTSATTPWDGVTAMFSASEGLLSAADKTRVKQLLRGRYGI